MVGGSDYEGELAAARLRMKAEQAAKSPAERQRMRDAEARETFYGRALVLALVLVVYALVRLFG